nr:hypothetical protein FEE99_27390 [Pseudomonas sp. ef1]
MNAKQYSNVGASLLAKAPCQSPSFSADRALSRAGSLPQGIRCMCMCMCMSDSVANALADRYQSMPRSRL